MIDDDMRQISSRETCNATQCREELRERPRHLLHCANVLPHIKSRMQACALHCAGILPHIKRHMQACTLHWAGILPHIKSHMQACALQCGYDMVYLELMLVLGVGNAACRCAATYQVPYASMRFMTCCSGTQMLVLDVGNAARHGMVGVKCSCWVLAMLQDMQ